MSRGNKPIPIGARPARKRPRLFTSGVVLVAVLALAPASFAQPDDPTADDPLVKYLSDRNLDELLADYLLDRLKTADGDAKARLAERLGSLYVKLLDAAKTPEGRTTWENRSQELLKAVPESDSFDLRLNLAKARYLLAEEVSERYRLRLASPEERQEAERVMRTTGASFQEIATKINRRVEILERKEGTARDEEAPKVREDLAEARRLRSLGMYYAGWASYYASFLAGKPAPQEALVDFGWLLNAAPGHEANVERIPPDLLRYEHVARSAIGVALCESSRGRDGAALLWIEALESAEGVPDAVRGQLFSRRMVILAQARRWSDLEYLIKKQRAAGGDKAADKDAPVKPLSVADARLLAVLSLEALQDKDTNALVREIVQRLADTAMTDLVALGEVRHVQDLVNKYGSAPLAGSGFIVQYVRGMQAYDHARTAHTATGKNTEDPAEDDAVKNLYRQAAASLQVALQQPDADHFGDERGNASLLMGLSLFYAGDLQQAADQFEKVFQAGATSKRSEDALWLAVVSLDKAVEGGKPSLKERLGGLATLYLKTYPKSDRAAKLLLRQSGVDLVSEDKAIEVLMGVAKDSPLYEAARRQAATLLYNIYRRSPKGSDKDFAALRFAEVSDELLRFDSRHLTEGSKQDRDDAAVRILVRARQVLDAVLGMTAPDLDRAEKAFALLDSLASEQHLDLSKVKDELTYRRLEVALARGKTDDANHLLDELHALGGRFADAADRKLYSRALSLLNTPNPPASAAADVVRHGLRVMDQFGHDAAALRDPAVLSLHNAVADAAARVWRQDHDAHMRDIALEIDKRLVALGNPPVPVLRRYAELSEYAGDRTAALDAWRLLLAGSNPTAPEWFESRYHSLRLLAAADPARAREALDQYKVLHPDFGLEPWAAKIKELDERVPAASKLPPVPAPSAPAPATGGPG